VSQNHDACEVSFSVNSRGGKVRAAIYRKPPVFPLGRSCQPLDYSPAAPIEQDRYSSFGHFKSPVTTAKEPSAIKTELYGRLPRIV
jgi:hypothetical protein